MSDKPPSYDASRSSSRPPALEDKPSGSRAERPQPLPYRSNESKSAALLQAQSRNDGSGKSKSSAGHSLARPGLFSVFRKHPHSELPSTQPPPDLPAVRAAVIEDVHLAVQPNTGSTAERLDLLENCALLCKRQNIDFPLLLQEKEAFHGHTALYWAIVNSPEGSRGPFDLVAVILARSSPLQPETIAEARRACISLRNQELFQFLRMCPEFGTLSPEDRLLLGVLVPPEEIDIELMEGPGQPFSVRFRIPQYRKRMLLSKEIRLEFIARGLLWQLSFSVNSQKQWLDNWQWRGSLRLAEDSPFTPVEFGLVFLDARAGITEPVHAWPQGSCEVAVHSKSLASCKTSLPMYRAKLANTGDRALMHLSKGDVVELQQRNDSGTWLVKKAGVEGFVMGNTLELVPAPSEATTGKTSGPMYRAMSDHTGKMVLVKDDLVDLVRQTDTGWALVKKDGVQGWATTKYLELAPWDWTMFGENSVCMAADGSIMGILGVKLKIATASTPRATIPTKPEDECVIC
ncbi:hypothetical protein C8J57DRAFT_1727871 [Mycena rebaudengoi]|nr:hypothetical protein C8J57DRAFT_1727871 [Mycena rebaudengoi]